MIPLDLLVSLPGMLSKSIKMSVPVVLEKNENAFLKLTTIQTKSYPVRCLLAKLRVTGDDFSVLCKLRCPGEANRQREIAIETSHSGVTVFEIKKASAVSLLGLFTLPVTVKERKSVLILPPPLKPANTVALQHGTILRPKPGGGFSEEHDIREYRQGDPVRSIHWKVSAKFDSLVIREPLVPPPHSRLVHVKPWKSATARDIILGCLRWVTKYMLKRQMPFYIKFGEEAVIKEITQESDLVDFLLYVLDKTELNALKSDPVPSRFSWIFRIDSGSGKITDTGEDSKVKTKARFKTGKKTGIKTGKGG